MDSEKKRIVIKLVFIVFKKWKVVIIIYSIWYIIEWKYREIWFWRWYIYS